MVKEPAGASGPRLSTDEHASLESPTHEMKDND
jgi:hypothetical protein